MKTGYLEIFGIDPAIAKKKLDELTPREKQVAEGLVAGETVKQAAERLGISPRTVEVFRRGIARKLQTRQTGVGRYWYCVAVATLERVI